MGAIGRTRSISDHGVFHKHLEDSHLEVATVFDDFVIVGIPDSVDNFENTMEKRFELSDVGDLHWN